MGQSASLQSKDHNHGSCERYNDIRAAYTAYKLGYTRMHNPEHAIYHETKEYLVIRHLEGQCLDNLLSKQPAEERDAYTCTFLSIMFEKVPLWRYRRTLTARPANIDGFPAYLYGPITHQQGDLLARAWFRGENFLSYAVYMCFVSNKTDDDRTPQVFWISSGLNKHENEIPIKGRGIPLHSFLQLLNKDIFVVVLAEDRQDGQMQAISPPLLELEYHIESSVKRETEERKSFPCFYLRIGDTILYYETKFLNGKSQICLDKEKSNATPIEMGFRFCELFGGDQRSQIGPESSSHVSNMSRSQFS